MKEVYYLIDKTVKKHQQELNKYIADLSNLKNSNMQQNPELFQKFLLLEKYITTHKISIDTLLLLKEQLEKSEQ
jgi:hypothetical protein